MAAQWGILGRTMKRLQDKAVDVVKACVLHNNLTYTDETNAAESHYIPPAFANADSAGLVQPGKWHRAVAGNLNLRLVQPAEMPRSHSTRVAVGIRDDIMLIML